MASEHIELPKETRAWASLVKKLSAAIVALLVVAGVLAAVLFSVIANNQSRAACGLYKSVAEAPLSTPTSPFAIALSASARSAYQGAHCGLGRLSPADKRVADYMKAGG
jgi:hypothetical protein